MFYFAYGSNTNNEIMTRNRPTSKYICRAILLNYDIDFRKKYATIFKKMGYFVMGVIWDINNAKDLENLDQQERVFNKLYQRIYITVLTEHGTNERCICYLMNTQKDNSIPDKKYINYIISGLYEHNISENYIVNIINKYKKKEKYKNKSL